MLDTEVMPGRLDSSLRFIDIKLAVSRSPRLYSRPLLVRRTDQQLYFLSPDVGVTCHGRTALRA